mmetsp:Transcript_66311/g.128180  ORF Transcript_66311/g.128180 Transcript_66311/m.128180 type:complete len:490 (-) Transcript_66311:230-1699(-)
MESSILDEVRSLSEDADVEDAIRKLGLIVETQVAQEVLAESFWARCNLHESLGDQKSAFVDAQHALRLLGSVEDQAGLRSKVFMTHERLRRSLAGITTQVRSLLCEQTSVVQLGPPNRLLMQLLWDGSSGVAPLGNWCQAKLSIMGSCTALPEVKYGFQEKMRASILHSVHAVAPFCVDIWDDAAEACIGSDGSHSFQVRVRPLSEEMPATTPEKAVHIVSIQMSLRLISDVRASDSPEIVQATFFFVFGSLDDIVVSACHCLGTSIHSWLDNPMLLCEAKNVGNGGNIWHCSQALCEHLHDRSLVPGCNIIELGAGTGVCGLICTQMGANSLLLTDLPRVCPVLQLNTMLNASFAGRSFPTISVVAWRWGDVMPAEAATMASAGPRLLVLLSYVNYDPVSEVPLVSTLCEILAAGGSSALAIMVHPETKSSLQSFVQLMDSAGLNFEPQECRPLPIRGWGSKEERAQISYITANSTSFSSQTNISSVS